MISNSVKNYLDYVKDVLGIKHLFFISKKLVSKKILIVVSDLDTYNPEENALLYKMVTALKLEQTDMSIVDSKNLNHYSAQYFLKLVDYVTESEKNSSDAVYTLSPRSLLKNAQHKKKAWADMQDFLMLLK